MGWSERADLADEVHEPYWSKRFPPVALGLLAEHCGILQKQGKRNLAKCSLGLDERDVQRRNEWHIVDFSDVQVEITLIGRMNPSFKGCNHSFAVNGHPLVQMLRLKKRCEPLLNFFVEKRNQERRGFRRIKVRSRHAFSLATDVEVVNVGYLCSCSPVLVHSGITSIADTVA